MVSYRRLAEEMLIPDDDYVEECSAVVSRAHSQPWAALPVSVDQHNLTTLSFKTMQTVLSNNRTITETSHINLRAKFKKARGFTGICTFYRQACICFKLVFQFWCGNIGPTGLCLQFFAVIRYLVWQNDLTSLGEYMPAKRLSEASLAKACELLLLSL